MMILQTSRTAGGRPMASGLLSAGLLSLVFGLLIIAAPELLAYIVASFFVVSGVGMLAAWWRLRRLR